MYQEMDSVLYGSQGVCKIVEITEKNFNGRNRVYYVLKPVFHESSTIFVPVDNETLTSRMCKVLSADEVRQLIHEMPDEKTIWIENEVERKGYYRTILSGGNRTAIVRMLKTLYQHQKRQQARGKKLHVADERFMKEAERILYEEFAHVLKIQRDQVVPFIMEEIQLENLDE